MPGLQLDSMDRPPYPTHVSETSATRLETSSSMQTWDPRRSFSGQSMFVEMLEEPEPTREQLEVSLRTLPPLYA